MKKILFLFVLIFTVTASVSAQKKKTGYRYALIFAYSQVNSVYEDDNIKLEIYDEQLWATNKTTKTIFIDLAQCFAVHNGASRSLEYTGQRDNKAKKGDKKASKFGISDKDDRFLTIAPSMGAEQNETYICYLSNNIYGTYSSAGSPSGGITDYDKKLLNTIAEMVNFQHILTQFFIAPVSRHFTEDESINNIGASIAYSFNKNTENWINVSLSTWVSDIIFAPYYVDIIKDEKNSNIKGFGYTETNIAKIHIRANNPYEFEEDKYPFIVCDWESDYRKGYFILSPIWVAKYKGLSSGIISTKLSKGESVYSIIYDKLYNSDIFKSQTIFDGEASDWGTPSYVKNAITTFQKIK